MSKPNKFILDTKRGALSSAKVVKLIPYRTLLIGSVHIHVFPSKEICIQRGK